ncbi:hypothetical protein [Paractinoplanes rishiriensis]|uniref:SHOCT domain-containing protein n=1 Tax=Paractinoplanes rishiriensis TaxID=1050105 RepID=A0A919KAU3_9ACTN|nr:hypothetical protein [Actinoplanes rishiriensis]GIF02071.1 hypothetical protein Ari01nite_95350 [Actinoplanes rishiriensis]
MFYLIAAVAAIILVSVLAAWAFPSAGIDDAHATAGTGKAAKRPDGEPVRKPESLEGVLVAQLVAGTISPVQYRRAVERIAARDEERHPLTVPPENGPAAA